MKKPECCLLEGPKTNLISKYLQLRKFEVSLEGAGGLAREGSNLTLHFTCSNKLTEGCTFILFVTIFIKLHNINIQYFLCLTSFILILIPIVNESNTCIVIHFCSDSK